MIVEPIWQSHITDIERREISPGKPSLLPDHPDALVIGGGLIGLWIAYFLAKKQAGRVLVVEQGELASGSSRANGGGVFAGQQRAEFPPAFRELGLASRELYAEIAEEDWADFDWSRNGSLAIAPTEFPCSMREYAQQECELSRVVKRLTAGELRALEPALADHVAEGIYYPEDAVVNPLRVALSLIRILRSMNVTLATGVRVTGFETRSRRILRVTTTAEDLHPGVVVLTTGWSADQLTEKLDVRVPVQPAKGQMLASPPLNWRLNTNLLGTQLLRQLPTGELITGGTVEFMGEDYEPSEANTDSIAARARRYC